MEKPKQYSVFKDHKFLCETDRPEGYYTPKYIVYIDTRYSAKLRLYNYMKKKEKEALKARLTDLLTYQVEKLVKSTNFELDEIVDIFQKVTTSRGAYITESEFIGCITERVLQNSTFVIESVDLVQVYELKQFCKEKSINLLTY